MTKIADYNPRLVAASLQTKKHRTWGYVGRAQIVIELRDIDGGEDGAAQIVDAARVAIKALSGHGTRTIRRTIVKRVEAEAPTKAREEDKQLVLRLAKALSATKPWREFVASGTWNQQTVQAVQGLDEIGTLLNQWWKDNGDK